MSWNYWKCRVFRRRNAIKRPWRVQVIETDAIVITCGTWAKAVRRAIKFNAVQSRTNGEK